MVVIYLVTVRFRVWFLGFGGYEFVVLFLSFIFFSLECLLLDLERGDGGGRLLVFLVFYWEFGYVIKKIVEFCVLGVCKMFVIKVVMIFRSF